MRRAQLRFVYVHTARCEFFSSQRLWLVLLEPAGGAKKRREKNALGTQLKCSLVNNSQN